MAGPSTRALYDRFIKARAGRIEQPIRARNGSVIMSETVAKTTSRITAVENGKGWMTSVAARTSDSAWASNSPVGVARW